MTTKISRQKVGRQNSLIVGIEKEAASAISDACDLMSCPAPGPDDVNRMKTRLLRSLERVDGLWVTQDEKIMRRIRVLPRDEIAACGLQYLRAQLDDSNVFVVSLVDDEPAVRRLATRDSLTKKYYDLYLAFSKISCYLVKAVFELDEAVTATAA